MVQKLHAENSNLTDINQFEHSGVFMSFSHERRFQYLAETKQRATKSYTAYH